MKRLLAALLALTLFAAACGDDDAAADDPEAQAAIQGLRAAIADSTAVDSSATFQVSDAEALCAAEAMFEEFGAARIIEASDQDFDVFMAAATQQERRATVDLLFECVDMKAAIAASIGPTDGIGDEAITCLVDGLLENEGFKDGLASEFAGDDAALSEEAVGELIFPLIFQCFSPEELTQLGGS